MPDNGSYEPLLVKGSDKWHAGAKLEGESYSHPTLCGKGGGSSYGSLVPLEGVDCTKCKRELERVGAFGS